MVGSEATELRQLIAILGVFNGAQLDNVAIYFLNLLKLLRVLLLKFGKKLDESLQNDASQLLQELVGLQGLARYVQRKIVGCSLTYERRSSKK